jgi:hypothetical protein
LLNCFGVLRGSPSRSIPSAQEAQLSEFVYIPVPTSSAPAVYKLLAGLGESSETSAAPADVEQIPEEVRRDAALVERMYRESHEGHRRLMEYLAASPGAWFYTSEIGTALDHENGAKGVAGMLGAFGKRANHRYGGHKPWETEWDGSREEARHRMDAETAETISTIAASVVGSR